jgi:hypothetical protein
MRTGTENRFTERYQLTAAIKFASSKNEAIGKAMIMNCSEGGAYFEAEADLQPGTPVFIANADDSKFFRAKVIWRKQLGRSNVKAFGIGIQYLDPSAEV